MRGCNGFELRARQGQYDTRLEGSEGGSGRQRGKQRCLADCVPDAQLHFQRAVVQLTTSRRQHIQFVVKLPLSYYRLSFLIDANVEIGEKRALFIPREARKEERKAHGIGKQ